MTEGCCTDEELVSRYKSETAGRERDALLNELFRRHYDQVGCWCMRLTGDREGAADMAQDVFLKAFRHLPSFQGASRFSTWLFAIARNHCLSTIRARGPRPEPAGQELLSGIADAQPDPEGLVERAESSRLLRELMATSLDERERQVMALHYGEDVPLNVITRLLGLANASGAKAYIVSARRKLERAVGRVRTGAAQG